MQRLIDRRRWPFVVVMAIVVIVSIAVVRLPDLFLVQIRQDRPLSSAQAGWVFRLLAAIACAQAIYGGFFALDPDRIKRSREKDSRLRDMSADAIATSAARNAAGMIFLTLVYGIADLALTGERGSFWLFPVVIVGQAAWYFRQVGQIGRWLSFQPEPDRGPARDAIPEIPPDWAPAIARGLTEPERTPQA